MTQLRVNASPWIDADHSHAAQRRLTIGICTHNRLALLCDLLRALIPVASEHGVEIIVADSASRPPVREVVDTMTTAGDPVRVIRVDRAGVSLARNALLNACRTPWLAFIDDDEMPHPGWLSAALTLIDRMPAACGACGGNVLPRWPGRRPAISRRARRYLSLIEHRGEFDQTSTPHFGVGHSIVRIDAMRDVGGFDPTLGRDGITLLSGEESDLVDMLSARGWRVWHSDKIAVDHLIPADRLDRSWLVDRAYWEGISVARRLARAPDQARRLVRVVHRRKIVLQLTARLLGETGDADLRLAFVEGVLAEEALNESITGPCQT